MLRGFPEAYQYAAVAFYERVSLGEIYEEYDRFPQNTRYDMSLSRSVHSRSGPVPKEALAKVNNYHGGAHWIKVTFNSVEAADRACYNSPHTLHGHVVYAERYRGEAPIRDEAIPATAEHLASVTTSPSQSISSTVQPNGQSSSTVTSETVTAARPRTPETVNLQTNSRTTTTGAATDISSPLRRPKTPLIKGAQRVKLMPAENALLPASNRWQQTFGAWPVISFFFGAASSDIIGNELPRKDDGTFDWEKASWYWTFWALLDYYLFFANFLGLKGDD